MSQLRRIEIKNIKAIDTFSIDFLDNKKLVLLIGRNNSGKTSILEAIRFFFSDDQKADELWPLDNSGNYKEIEEKPYILAEINFSNDEIDSIKEELKTTQQDKILDEFLIDGSNLIIKKPINKTAKDIKAKGYECKRKDNGKFENFTGLIQNTTRFIPRYIYLPSLVNLEDYTSASQRAEHTFEELFSLYFEGLKWEENGEITNLVSSLIKKINELIGIEDIKQKIDTYLKEIDDVSIEKLEQGFQSVNDVANIIKKVKIVLNDGVISDARLKGSGTQRGLIFSLLRLIAEKRKNTKGRETIFLIDEPDLHLHPQLQKQIKVILEKLSSNYPVIVATHSHLMIGKKLSTFGVIKKIYKENNIVKEEDISNEEKLFRELFTYLGYIPSDFLLPDNLILVEGKFDKQFLEKIVELMQENGDIKDGYGISIIDIGGDGQAKKALKFIQDLPSAISFFQGLPAYQGRFCGLFDKSKEKSLIDLRSKANDGNEPYRINCLDKNGIEYYYPNSLLTKMGKKVEDIVKSNEEKSKAADFVNKNITKDHLKEVDNKIKNLIKLAFQKAEIL